MEGIDSPSSAFTPTERSRVRRVPQRASYDRAVVHAILDEGWIAHVGFVDAEQAFVIPMAYARVGERIYLHAARSARIATRLGSGAAVCLTVTLLDGLVLARSAFHHSMNFRSAIVLGRASLVEDPAERLLALEALVERSLPGRWAQVRPPSTQELRATAVLALPIEEASAKSRSGPPLDDAEDLGLPVWAGVVPLSVDPGPPEPDPGLARGVELPAALAELAAR